jgi:hypothetical protein
MFFNHRILPALLSSLPGMGMNVFYLLTRTGQYWEPVFQAAAVVFILAGAVCGPLLAGLLHAERARIRAAAAVFCAVLLAWLACSLVIGLLNLTPLCVGQNNGDGMNDLGMCIFISSITAVSSIPLAVLSASFCAALAAIPGPRRK